MPEVFISGAFDDLRSRDVRFLQEAARLEDLTVLLWSDESFRSLVGRLPEFPQAERQYMLEAIRSVKRVILVDGPVDPDQLPLQNGPRPDLWAVSPAEDSPAKNQFCISTGIGYRVIPASQLDGFPAFTISIPDAGRAHDRRRHPADRHLPDPCIGYRGCPGYHARRHQRSCTR